jgi:hypothetical protein
MPFLEIEHGDLSPMNHDIDNPPTHLWQRGDGGT